MKSDVLLLKIVFDFLSQLSDKQLNDVLNGKAKLRIEVDANDEIAESSKVFSIDSICADLERIDSRDMAIDYFYQLNLSKPILKQLVKHYKIPLAGKATNVQMIDSIIEAVVGSRLRYNALYSTNLNK